jgi:hypothetical protein
MRSHNAPAGLTAAIEGKEKGIDVRPNKSRCHQRSSVTTLTFFEQKIYLSPLDDIHYVIKWQDGSFVYCLPFNWAADLDSLIGNHSGGNGRTGGRTVVEREKQNLSMQGQMTVMSQTVKKAVVRAPPGPEPDGMHLVMNDANPLLQNYPITDVLHHLGHIGTEGQQ